MKPQYDTQTDVRVFGEESITIATAPIAKTLRSDDLSEADSEERCCSVEFLLVTAE